MGVLPAKEWSYGGIPGGGATRSEPAFGRDIVARGFGDRALIGDTDVLSLSIYGADGRLARRIRGAGGGWAVTNEEIEASRAERLGLLGPDAPDWYRHSVENAPHRETHPAFHSALLGPDEMVWIGLAIRLGEETRRWLVIGADGQPRGWLALPAEARVLAMDADRFAVLLRDANDEEEVRLYSYGPSRKWSALHRTSAFAADACGPTAPSHRTGGGLAGLQTVPVVFERPPPCLGRRLPVRNLCVTCMGSVRL